MTEALKHDTDKLRYDLLPPFPLEQVVKVLTYGAKKYGDRNWEKGLDVERIYAAAMRHMQDWKKGVTLDAESNLPHIAHAACNLFFILEYERGNSHE